MRYVTQLSQGVLSHFRTHKLVSTTHLKLFVLTSLRGIAFGTFWQNRGTTKKVFHDNAQSLQRSPPICTWRAGNPKVLADSRTRENQTKAQSDKVMQIFHMFSYLSLPDTVPGSVEYKSDGIVNVDIQQLPSLSSSHGSTPRR